MIKRRFYKLEHAERDNASDASSSSSDSELEVEATDESEEDDLVVPKVKEGDESSSSSSSRSSDVVSDDDSEIENEGNITSAREFSEKCDSEVLERKLSVIPEQDLPRDDFESYVLKCKSVFKCRICPRVVCLTEDTLKSHLKSKKHARSEKLLNEGKLKAMLNSDGKIEEQLTAAEMHASTLAIVEDNHREKSKGGKLQERKSRKKKRGDSRRKQKRLSAKSPSKKRSKNDE